MENIPTKEISFKSKDEAISWILMNQLGRRNLTDFQKNEIALKHEAIIAKQMKERQTEGQERGRSARYGDSGLRPNDQKPEPTTTRKELAKIAGTSEGSIQRTKLILEKGTPEQIEQVRQGKESVGAMARKIKDSSIPDGMKKCSKCGKVLPVGDFYDHHGSCKDCYNSVKRYKDKNGKTIQTDEKYKNVSNQSIIDGLYKDEPIEVTIEEVVHEFMVNFREYMSSLEQTLKCHSRIVSQNKKVISEMWEEADIEFQKARREYV